MGTLVLDIETASPFEEPPDNSNDTKYYEWFAVSLAYADELTATPETEVLFRRGGWDDSHTVDLYQRMFDWCDQRDVERLLTYNGAWFDGRHLLNWASDIDDTTDHTFREQTETLFDNHIDVAIAAADEHSDELWDDQHILPDWKAYNLAEIDNDGVWYDDYDFPDTYLSEIDGSAVQGKHIGQSSANATSTTSKQASKRLASTENSHDCSKTTAQATSPTSSNSTPHSAAQPLTRYIDGQLLRLIKRAYVVTRDTAQS